MGLKTTKEKTKFHLEKEFAFSVQFVKKENQNEVYFSKALKYCTPPEKQQNFIFECPMSKHFKSEYYHKFQEWLDSMWLVPYLEKDFSTMKGLIPIMAVVQKNKMKVHTVLEYQELNEHVNVQTAHADICAQKLR